MKKQLLSLALVGFMATSANAQTVVFSEDFTAGSQPSGWTQDSAGQQPQAPWFFNDPGARAGTDVTGANFDANFMIFDSDFFGSGATQGASITTPSINCSAISSVYIIMDESYRSYPGQDHTLEVSADGGATWTTFISGNNTNGYPTATTVGIDISSVAANQANVQLRFFLTATYGWWWAIDNLKVQDQIFACSAPLAGTTGASANPACPTSSTTLSLGGASGGSGLTYQWFDSPDGVTFTAIAGATNATYVTNITATTYYHCTLDCGGIQATSTDLEVTVNPIPGCQCYPVNPVCGGTDYISNVTLNTLNNTSTCDAANSVSNFTYYTAAQGTTSLSAGMNYDLSVTTEDDNIVSVWFDFNHDGNYDASEWTQVCTTSLPSTANIINIAVPAGAFNGVTGMRIRSRLVNNQNGATDACLQMGSGETEDYEITITNGVNGIATNQLKGLTVFPSPASTVATVNFGRTLESAMVVVYDMTGKMVDNINASGSKFINLNTASYPNGIYNIAVNAGIETANLRLVIAK